MKKVYVHAPLLLTENEHKKLYIIWFSYRHYHYLTRRNGIETLSRLNEPIITVFMFKRIYSNKADIFLFLLFSAGRFARLVDIIQQFFQGLFLFG